MTEIIAIQDTLLAQAAYLSEQAYAPTTEPFKALGYRTIELDGLTVDGEQMRDIGALAGQPPGTFTSHAYLVEGTIEGERTVALVFRGTDEGGPEFAFQGSPLPGGAGFVWDLYQQAHAPLAAAALRYAAESGAERFLVTGQSLGGIIAELTVARVVAASDLADRSVLVTLGSPGSTAEVPGDIATFNLVHSDDIVAQLSRLSPLFQLFDAAREGVDIEAALPQGRIGEIDPATLTTQAGILAALQDPAARIEHSVSLYTDTAEQLSLVQAVVPGVAGSDDPLRWLDITAENVVLGTVGADRLAAAAGGSVLIGLAGTDILLGGEGDDGLAGGDNGDVLDGGAGDDRLLGGYDRDLLTGGEGADRFVFRPGDGRDIVTDFVDGEDSLDLSALGLELADLDSNGDGVLDGADSFVKVKGDDLLLAYGRASDLGSGERVLLLDVTLISSADGAVG